MMYFVFAFVAGMGLSIQAAINSRLGVGLGGQSLLAALVSFGVGTLCLLAAAAVIADWNGVDRQALQQPWWRWIGGMIGAVVVFTSIVLAPKIGITNTMFLFILGQLTMGMVIDSFGLVQMPLRPVHWWKFAGLGLMLAGLAVFMFGDKLRLSWF